MAYHNPALLQIMIATAALHMANACAKASTSLGRNADTPQSRRHRCDALIAKQRSLRFLRSALGDVVRQDLDATLATVLLSIELDLIDSGRNDWKFHMDGARVLVDAIDVSDVRRGNAASPLRTFLVSNYTV